jgi:hypothetical protein
MEDSTTISIPANNRQSVATNKNQRQYLLAWNR